MLADGTMKTCSLEDDPELFRAGLVSLGCLGIIVRITLRASPSYNLAYTTEIISFERFLKKYVSIWKSAEYVRVWWWPYTRKVVIWRGNRTHSPRTASEAPSSMNLRKNVHEMSLYALKYTPSLLPRFEKILFHSQFPGQENVVSETLVDNPHRALQIDCLFSQYVDEWSIPLSSGVEAISRLDNWISTQDTSVETGIPVQSTKRVYVHAPIELRVNSGKDETAYLAPAKEESGPVLYIGVIMYRAYYSPVSYREYFTAYEHLMRYFGGKPHWAKQHCLTAREVQECFGEGMKMWLSVRGRVDPTNMFVNGFIKRHVLVTTTDDEGSTGVGILDGESGRLYKRFRAAL